MRQITDRQMAAYWTRRVKELQSMRPITQAEAADVASDEREAVAILDVRIASERQEMARVGARRAPMTYGLETYRCQHMLRADAFACISIQPVGDALSDSLSEAERRAEYYSGLASTPRTQGI